MDRTASDWVQLDGTCYRALAALKFLAMPQGLAAARAWPDSKRLPWFRPGIQTIAKTRTSADSERRRDRNRQTLATRATPEGVRLMPTLETIFPPLVSDAADIGR